MKSDLAKAVITGEKRKIEHASVKCTCTLKILCTIQYTPPSQLEVYIVSSGYTLQCTVHSTLKS